MNIILNRKSIRKYKDIKVSSEIVEDLLRAAMAAPSAGNEQPWDFIILRDKAIMKKITEFHPYSKPLLNADVAIVVCGDKAKEKFEGYWVQDCSAASENILLAAEDKGLGAVWLGVYPLEDRIIPLKELLNLPESVIPLSIISIGYPDEQRKPEDRFNKQRIHYDRW
ncbi:NADH dehydrogenase [Clostridium carboxidivorans P7]|uniref:Nitroreductase n=1 Tax=Clostridium carboxidivorans P7 TaxID=536227 RepID=C6PTU0_9CLOT|nr:nitroreductase family protein [Clostridium carboxidivorans]AKN31438.1 NADH dehydrogenase [Clostridium carboxidivorans P7]EET87330.1 nitroreductase [Clostridium carboxidivorans P7]EFG87172.1 nitroreductase family protein [Clostridium carboxidivorans P7]